MKYPFLNIYSDDVSGDIIKKLKKFCQLAVDENKHDTHRNMQAQIHHKRFTIPVAAVLLTTSYLKHVLLF